MPNEPDSVNQLDSEHLVGKVLAAQPPILVSALVLSLGLALAVAAVMHMRRRPRAAIWHWPTREQDA